MSFSCLDDATRNGAQQNTRHRWCVVYTRHRHEALVSSELSKKSIETFLPERCVIHRWSDRRKEVMEPLFKGYLFVHMKKEDRLNVLKTRGLVRFVGAHPAMPSPIADTEMDTLQQFIENEIRMDPFPYLKQGQRVYVRSGPFKGAQGFVIRKNRHCRLVISLDLLMQSISVEIDEAWVEPI